MLTTQADSATMHSALCSFSVLFQNDYKFTGKERDSESGLDNFGARYFGSSLGRFQTPDPVFMNIMRVMDPQRLNLYAYGRNNPLVYTDPTGKDIVSGTGDQKAVKAALVEIAKHPGGREFLTKLDNISAKIAVSTGTGLTNRNGDPVYGKTAPQAGQNPAIQRVTDSSGKIVDVKGPNVDTTVDFGFAKQDKNNGVPGAPQSDAELLGHELKHDENQFFKQPDSEQGATQGIDDILGNKPTKESKQGAEEFVDNLLKPNSQNQNNQQQQPPPPKCSGDNKQNCSN